MKITIVRNSESLQSAVTKLSQQFYIGFDTETTGLDPHQARLRLLQLATADESFIIDLFQFPKEELSPVLQLLAADAPIKIAHNAKFDASFLMKHLQTRLGAKFDTYLASLLISAGRESDRHSLEATSLRFLNLEMDKSSQLSDWSGELSERQLEYAALDAQILLALREKMQLKLEELTLTEVAQLEFDCINPVAAMQLAGIHLDAECWRVQVEKTEIEYDEVAAKLRKELSAGLPQMSLFEEATSRINLDSPAQIKDALNRLGIEVDSTSEWRLHNLAAENPVIELLLKYRGLSKSLSAYGRGLLDHVNQASGRIHANFRQIGTPTGRMGCSSPGLHQIPSETKYRQCFRAPTGRKLVIADFSQIEMRILAEFSGDEALITAFKSGADLHRSTYSQMLGTPLDEVTSEQRSQAKGLNFGLVYGMGAEGLANKIGCSVPEAEKLINKYFAAYPDVARWLNEAANTAVSERQSRSASGRLWKFNFDVKDRSQLGALRRVGKNAPIQGTGSDLFKRAMILIDAALKDSDAQIVHCIHDEFVVECDEQIAGEIAEIVSCEMVTAGKEYLPRVPVVAEAKISDVWIK